MIEKPTLKTKDAVQVDSPVYKAGVSELISTHSADTTNSSTNLNQTASQEDLSAKFKYPNVKQEVPAEGRGQYLKP